MVYTNASGSVREYRMPGIRPAKIVPQNLWNRSYERVRCGPKRSEGERMSYKPIKIQDGLLEQKKEKERLEGLKNQPAYDKVVAEYDKRVIKMLQEECLAAEKNDRDHEQYIHHHKENMENTIHSVEELLKKKEFDRFAFQEVKAATASFPQFVAQIKQDVQALGVANRQYREDWVKEAAALLSPGARPIVAPFVVRRQEWLSRATGREAAVARCQEYVVRIQEYFKQAAQRMNRIEKDELDLKDEEKDLVKSTQGITAKIQNEAKTLVLLRKSMAGIVEGIKKSGAAKTWDGKQTLAIKPQMVKLAAAAKTGRGHLQTCNVLLAGLQKRGQASVPELRDYAAKALREAQTPYKEALQTSKGLDTEEKDCATICKNHGVSV
jgi:hypothetical protein